VLTSDFAEIIKIPNKKDEEFLVFGDDKITF
jgi:hypothetical protein